MTLSVRRRRLDLADDIANSIVAVLYDDMVATTYRPLLVSQVSVRVVGAVVYAEIRFDTAAEAEQCKALLASTTFATDMTQEIGEYAVVVTEQPYVVTVDLTPPSTPPPTAPGGLESLEETAAEINVGGSGGSDGLSTGAIVGIVFGVLAGLVALGLGFYLSLLHKRWKSANHIILKAANSGDGMADEAAEPAPTTEAPVASPKPVEDEDARVARILRAAETSSTGVTDGATLQSSSRV